MSSDPPAPSPGPDYRPRKSKYGRAPKVRNVDRNERAKNRVERDRRNEGKLRYGKGAP